MKKWIFAGLASASLAACGASGDTATSDDAAGDAATETAPDSTDAEPVEVEDAKVPGTEYNATAPVNCGFGGAAPTETCDAGVIRNWGEDGTTLVEVQKPDGFKRAIFFNGTEPYGADSAEADGSAGWDFTSSRDGDRITINYGPETYVIVDAMITGG